jgi:hypothetical protein
MEVVYDSGIGMAADCMGHHHCYIVLLIYRSTLTMKEDDQLFLDESSTAMAAEQRELIAKVDKINPLVKVLGATSGLMILVIAGWAVYIGLNSVQP